MEIAHFVKRVQVIAAKNQKIGLDTVLFFDEANTSDAIELIKEIMCDRRLNGEAIQEDIKFIAACNPYKRYSDMHTRNHTIHMYVRNNCALIIASLSVHHKAF